jgi:4-diphosphocytidyl-2-C-methyl-D-erythritol kinase
MPTHYPAPAKLNLFLHVTGRRADGYHLLQSVFQLIDLADQLQFTLRDDGQIHRITEVPGVAAESDLIVRAAQSLQTAARSKGMTPPGVDIAIEKNIPMGGGLGGGSSDAATTLMALNHLWQTGLSRAELMQLGVKLGADVPFFLGGENAFVEGIGEQLTPLTTQETWFVVVHPGVAVPTPLIFGAEDLTRDTKAVKMLDFSGQSNSFGRNDLQQVAVRLFPEVASALAWLSNYAPARMTGSGACVFAAMESETAAQAVVENVPVSWRAWKAKTLRRHPLADGCSD